MWQNFGDIKNNLGKLTNKTLESVAKAGLRAKEMLNQVDDDDEVFDKEANDSKLKYQETTNKNLYSNNNNRYDDIISLDETAEATSILNDSNPPKTLSWKEKAQEEVSPLPLRQSSYVNPPKNVLARSVEGFMPTERPIVAKTVVSQSSENIFKGNNLSGINGGDYSTGRVSGLENEQRASNQNLEKTVVERKNAPNQNEKELDKNLTSSQTDSGEFIRDNRNLQKEKEDLRELVAGAKVNTLNSNVEIPKERKQEIFDSIHNSIERYKEQISFKILESMNKHFIDQSANEEEGVYKEARNLLNSWLDQTDIIKESIKDMIPEEKIIQSVYKNNPLSGELKSYQEENEKLRTQAEGYEKYIKQLEAQGETQQTTGFEKKIKNLGDEINEYKSILLARHNDIEYLQKTLEEKEAKLSSLETKIKSESAQKHELGDQYESMVSGMKEFEETMSQLNRDNERLSNEYESIKSKLVEEKKKVREYEHSLPIETKDKLLEKLSKLNALAKGFEIENIINSQIVAKEGRVSTSSLLEALEHGLTQALRIANKKFDSQLETERGKERDKNNVLSKNFDTLQGELREALKREKELLGAREDLRKKNEELTDIVENLNSLGGSHANRIISLQKEKESLEKNNKKFKAELNEKKSEIEQLKIKYNTLVEQANQTAHYAAKIEAEAELIPELSTKLENLSMEVGSLTDMIRAKEEENELLNTTVTNLQAVIDESQQLQENMINQYNNEIKKLRADIEQGYRKSHILQEYKDKFEAMEKEFNEREHRIKELNMKLKESEQEKNVIKSEAAALIKKAKSEATYKENLVDKRVITSFLMKYFDFNATFAVKIGILETMSSILSFTEDERIKLGLPRQGPGSQEPIQTKLKDESPRIIEERKINQKENTPETVKHNPDTAKQNEQDSLNVKKEEKELENQAQPQQQKSFKQMFMSFLLENE